MVPVLQHTTKTKPLDHQGLNSLSACENKNKNKIKIQQVVLVKVYLGFEHCDM